jgi:hypothetical protein
MKCIEKKANGKHCQANAMRGAKYCYLHNPAISKETKTALARKGGENRAVTVITPAEPLRLDTIKDAKTLIADTINNVRSGNLDIRIANCLGVLSGHLIKAIETESIEQRLEQIEQTLIDTQRATQ